MKKVAFVIFLGLLVAFVAAGCGAGNNSVSSTAQGSQLSVNFGDATNDQIIGFELTVNSVTLTGNGNPSVLSKPAEIEFVHNAATVETLSLTKVPAGTYTGATITVSNPEVVIIDPNTKQPVKLTATLAHNTVSVNFNLTVGPNASVLNFDLNLATSVSISGNTATVDPQFSASTSTVAANNDNEDEDNGENHARGTVTDITAPNFTIQPAGNGQPITFATDNNTRFHDGINSLAQMMKGMIVSVEAVTKSDGTLLAKEVEAETEDANGEEVEGVITAESCATATGCPSTGNPATQITITTQKSSSSSTAQNTPGMGDSVNIPITNSTRFSVQSRNLTGTLPAFDATHIGKAQRIEADSENEAGDTMSSVSGDKIKLQEQALTGTVSGVTGTFAPGGSFTLTVDQTSAFASLTGTTTVTVQTQTGTEMKNVTVSNGGTIRVRGLLFFDGTAYTLVASRITP